jgi:hypothetical protein
VLIVSIQQLGYCVANLKCIENWPTSSRYPFGVASPFVLGSSPRTGV